MVKFPASKSEIAKFLALAPKEPPADPNDIQEVDSISVFANQVTTFEKLVNAKVASLAASDPIVTAKPSSSASPTPTATVNPTTNSKTITCIKGKTVKKVKGAAPKCPTGYKLKA